MRMQTRNAKGLAAPAASLLMAMAVALGGCASKPPPTEQFAVSAAAIDAARAAGAPQYAPVELSAANAKLEQARRLAATRQQDKARELAEQAEVDAQVARSKADAERSRRAVAEVDAGLRLLRQELDRTAPAGTTNSPTPLPAPSPTTPANPVSPAPAR